MLVWEGAVCGWWVIVGMLRREDGTLLYGLWCNMVAVYKVQFQL